MLGKPAMKLPDKLVDLGHGRHTKQGKGKQVGGRSCPQDRRASNFGGWSLGFMDRLGLGNWRGL